MEDALALQPHLDPALSAQAKQVIEDDLPIRLSTSRPEPGGLRKRGKNTLVKTQTDLDRYEQVDHTERARSGKAKPDIKHAAI